MPKYQFNHKVKESIVKKLIFTLISAAVAALAIASISWASSLYQLQAALGNLQPAADVQPAAQTSERQFYDPQQSASSAVLDNGQANIIVK